MEFYVLLAICFAMYYLYLLDYFDNDTKAARSVMLWGTGFAVFLIAIGAMAAWHGHRGGLVFSIALAVFVGVVTFIIRRRTVRAKAIADEQKGYLVREAERLSKFGSKPTTAQIRSVIMIIHAKEKDRGQYFGPVPDKWAEWIVQVSKAAVNWSDAHDGGEPPDMDHGPWALTMDEMRRVVNARDGP